VRTILAVDGGNSKTDVALVQEDGRVLGLERGAQSSPDHLGLDGSLTVVADLAGRVGGRADVAVLLLAGVDFADEEAAYHAAAERRGLGAKTIVGNDTFAVLRAGTDRPFGVAVTCGAGINCVGVAPDGRRVRFASLGGVSGDWGGGYDVGLAAAGAAARSQDGRGPHTVLEQLVPAHFRLETPVELARAVVAGRIADRELQGLAPLVFAAAGEDAVARGIVDRLADEVVTMAATALRRLGLLGETVDVVLGGSLLQAGHTRLLERIGAGLHTAAPAAHVRVAELPPVLGAALVGLDELGASADAHARLRSELGAAVAA
jgi:N-acetylglucosamine kinase-like BadF-type ATPase